MFNLHLGSLVVLGAGLAETPQLQVTAEPKDVVVLYQEAAKAAGYEGAALLPACREWSPHFFMCFMVEEDEVRRMVHLGDLGAWGMSLEQAEAAARVRAQGSFTMESGREVYPEGMGASYWVFDSGDGLASTALLLPRELEKHLGGMPNIAVPGRDLVIAWVPGDPEFDRMIAIGVRRLYEESDQPVSPVVMRRNGKGWTRWGEAHATP